MSEYNLRQLDYPSKYQQKPLIYLLEQQPAIPFFLLKVRQENPSILFQNNTTPTNTPLTNSTPTNTTPTITTLANTTPTKTTSKDGPENPKICLPIAKSNNPEIPASPQHRFFKHKNQNKTKEDYETQKDPDFTLRKEYKKINKQKNKKKKEKFNEQEQIYQYIDKNFWQFAKTYHVQLINHLIPYQQPISQLLNKDGIKSKDFKIFYQQQEYEAIFRDMLKRKGMYQKILLSKIRSSKVKKYYLNKVKILQKLFVQTLEEKSASSSTGPHRMAQDNMNRMVKEGTIK